MLYTEPMSLALDAVVVDIVKIGFPEKVQNSLAFCSCHNKPSFTHYVCPFCNARNCNIPTDCVRCKVMLASAPHLARTNKSSLTTSTYELFKVKEVAEAFANGLDIEIEEPAQKKTREEKATEVTAESVAEKVCAGCDIKIADGVKETEGFFSQCPACLNDFCLTCDAFI